MELNVTHQREQYAAVIKELGPRVSKFKKNEQATRSEVLDHVFAIFTESSIDPAKAAFVVGRIFEALQPLVNAQIDRERYDAAVRKVKQIDTREDKRKKAMDEYNKVEGGA